MARPYVIGLTGSIAMGKSVTAHLFEMQGVKAFSADDTVHRLYERDFEVIDQIAAIFPGVVTNGYVDRGKLSKRVQGSPKAIAALEKIVHPALKKEQQQFLREAEHEGREYVVMNIPLLFENKMEEGMDAIVVVTAPGEIQRSRALARPGMTSEKFEYFLSLQIPDAEKRKKADFVVVSDKGLEDASGQVVNILSQLRSRKLK